VTTDLLYIIDALELRPAPATPGAALEELIDRLAVSVRTLTREWWLASDRETALDAARAGLKRLNVGVTLDEAAFATRDDSVAATVTDDDLRRRHQLGFLAVFVNAALAARGEDRRFRCLGEALAWEPGEPPWLLVVPEEYAALHALVGGCAAGLEAAYDGATALPA
jgi:hypothetical protein